MSFHAGGLGGAVQQLANFVVGEALEAVQYQNLALRGRQQGQGLVQVVVVAAHAHLPEGGSLEVILAAPIPPFGVHYGVRIAALRQPEGLALDGATFGANQRAHFDELTPGEWVVMVLSLDSAEQVVDRRQPQTILVKSGKTTEFTAGW